MDAVCGDAGGVTALRQNDCPLLYRTEVRVLTDSEVGGIILVAILRFVDEMASGAWDAEVAKGVGVSAERDVDSAVVVQLLARADQLPGP